MFILWWKQLSGYQKSLYFTPALLIIRIITFSPDFKTASTLLIDDNSVICAEFLIASLALGLGGWDPTILAPWYSPYRDHITLCLGMCNNNIHCSRNLASLTNLIQVLINIRCSSRTPDLHYLRHQHHSLSHYSLNSFGEAISNVATGSV